MAEFEELLERPADDADGPVESPFESDAQEHGTDVERPRRFRKLRVYGPWVLAALSLLIALLPTILSTAWTRDLILSWLESNVDRPVRFAELDVSWWDGVEITDLEIHDPDAPDRPLLRVPRVHVEAALLPLLGRRLVVSSCVLDRPEIRITRTDEGTSVDGAINRKPRGGGREDAAGKDDEGDRPDERFVLPELSVPLEVRDATLIFRGRSGREVRREGISLTADVTTRAGPTTFDLRVPDGSGQDMRVSGELRLFDAEGALLDAGRRGGDVALEIVELDAARHADLLALALGDREVAGVLSVSAKAKLAGAAASGSLRLRLAGVGVGDAAQADGRADREDLRVAAAWSTDGERVSIDDLEVRAAGVKIDADVVLGWGDAEGSGTLDVDLVRLDGHLADLGVGSLGALGGRLQGSFEFPGGTATGSGELTATDLRAAAQGDRPELTIGPVRVGFRATPGAKTFTLDELRLSVPGLDVSADAIRDNASGEVVAAARVEGRVEELLATARSLGLAPERLDARGAIEGTIAAAYRPQAGGVLIEVQRLAIVEGDTQIRVLGRREPDGLLGVTAEGGGDLARLLRLDVFDGEPEGVPDGAQGAFRGTFDFAASAQGMPDALALTVSKLNVSGNLTAACSGEVAADGAVGGALDVQGTLDDLALLAQRVGVLDRDFAVPGRLSVIAKLSGTRDQPVLDTFTVTIADGPLLLDGNGSLDAEGAVSGRLNASADLDRLAEVLHDNGLLEQQVALAGKLEGHVRVTGTRDALLVPSAVLTCAGGPLELEVNGRVGEHRRLEASISCGVPLDEIAKLARAGGLLSRDVELPGALRLDANVGGTLDEIAVPTAGLRIDGGPLTAHVVGALDPSGVLNVEGECGGAFRTVADLVRAARGLEAPRDVDGSVAASFTVNGPRERPHVRLPELSLQTGGMTLKLTGTRTTEGAATLHGDVRGPVEDAIAALRALGIEKDWDAKGRLTAILDVESATEAEGGDLRATLLGDVEKLVLRRPELGDGPFREEKLQFEMPVLRWDREAGAPELVQARLRAAGLDLEVRVAPPDDAAAGGRDLLAKGRILVEEEFARGHPKLLSELDLASLEIPFQVRGDLAAGRERLADWSGEFLVNGKDIRTTHLHVETTHLTGRIDDGRIRIDPVDATVNTGKVTGNVTIGLTGDEREHAAVLNGTDLQIDHALAPLLARVLPVFAVGEYGKVGGKLGFDVDLTARGASKEDVQASLSGDGEVRVRDAFVQSDSWLEKVLSAVGKGDKVDLPEVVAPFRVRDGRVVTDGIPVASSHFLMRLEGDVSLDGDLDYRVKVKPTKGSSFERYAKFLDPDGFLPLRLGGAVSDPDVKLPSLTDVLTGDGVKDALKDALDRYRKRKEDKEKEEDEKGKAGDGKKRAGDGAGKKAGGGDGTGKKAENADDDPDPKKPRRKKGKRGKKKKKKKKKPPDEE